ncbi:MAG: PEP-CTERM sorting domain-containing protein [Pseudomonadota bacterium]
MKQKVFLSVFLILLLSCYGLANAVPITYNGQLSNGIPGSALIDPATDTDYWWVEGTAGDVVTISMNRISNRDTDGDDIYDASTLDPYVSLYQGYGDDTALTFLVDDDDSGSNLPPMVIGSGKNALITAYTLTATGKYTLLASSSKSATYGPYQLTVTGITPVPEPATMLLLGAGFVGIAGIAKKK